MGNGPLGKVGRVYKQARKDEFKITLSMATKEEDVRMKWGDTETPAVTGKVWDYIGEQIRGEELQTIYDAGLEGGGANGGHQEEERAVVAPEWQMPGPYHG